MIQPPARVPPTTDRGVASVYCLGTAMATAAALHGVVTHGTAGLLALTFAGAVASAHAGAMLLIGYRNDDTYWTHSIGAVLHALGAGVALAEGMRALASVAAPMPNDVWYLPPAAVITALAGLTGLWLAGRGATSSPVRAGMRLGAAALLASAVISAATSTLPRLLGWEAAPGPSSALGTLAIGTAMAVFASLLLAGSRDRS